jgi:hypothetical protein
MRSGGIGASVSSWISENLLEDLDHEVIRLSSQDVPTAYAKLLEDGALHCALVCACGLAAFFFRAQVLTFTRPYVYVTLLPPATIVQAKDVLTAIKKICA